MALFLPTTLKDETPASLAILLHRTFTMLSTLADLPKMTRLVWLTPTMLVPPFVF